MAHLVVRHPDGGEAGRFGRHHVDTVSEVNRQVLHARACKLEHLVLDKSVLKYGLDERYGHVVRTDALARRAFQPHEHHLGRVDVPGVAQELLGQFAAAFAHAHVAERAVAGVRVGTQNHVAALHHGLAGELVDDGHVGGHVDAAVFFRSREAEDVVVLVDGASHGAERVVAVGERVGQGEGFEARGAGRLDDAYVGDVVAHHGVEADAHLLALGAIDVVGAENLVGYGLFACLVGRGHAFSAFGKRLAVEQVNTVVDEFNHSAIVCKFEEGVWRPVLLDVVELATKIGGFGQMVKI